MKSLATILVMIMGSVALVGCIPPDHVERTNEDVAKAKSAIESELGGEVEIHWFTPFGQLESETSVTVVFVKPPTKIPRGKLRQRLIQIVNENFRVPVQLVDISFTPVPSLGNSAELIESLHQERIETFTYDRAEWPDNLRGIVDRTDNVSDLIAAYNGGDPDHVFRFNLIMILIAKAERSIDDDDKTKIIECLHQALRDPHAWVKGEAVWGLGVVGSIGDIPDIIPLLSDEDEIDEGQTVARVARGALVEILTLPALMFAGAVVIIVMLWRSYRYERKRTGPISLPQQEALETRAVPFVFTGNADEYFKIWIVNVALTICTLGIYSSWAKVRKKRYLYGNTLLNGSPFEYHGDPIKILKGRLIVVGGLLLYFATTPFLPFIEDFSWLLFLLILPLLVVIARNFNARNSSYRNIRFDFRARYGEAYEVLFGLSLLAILTAGLAYPYLTCRRSEFVVSHNRYGTTPLALSWHRPISKFYGFYVKVGFWGFAWGVITAVLIGGLAWVIGAIFNVPTFGYFSTLFLGSGYLVSLGAFAYLKSEITNFVWSNVTLGKHRFESSLVDEQMIWLYISNALGILFSLGLLIPWATIRTIRYRLAHFKLLASSDLDEFVASQQEKVAATGEEASEFFDVDIDI